MKEAFGLTRDKVKEKFNTKITADMKDIGEMIKEKVKACFFKITLQFEFSIDFNIFFFTF